MFAMLVAMYFYSRVVDFKSWPPPQVNRLPILSHRARFVFADHQFGSFLLSVAPMFWADRACLKRNVPLVKIGMVLCVLLGLVVIAIRVFRNFIHFIFTGMTMPTLRSFGRIVGLHLTHLVIATSENLIMTIWVFVKGLDDKHARDIRVTATYWYWVAGIWVLLFLIIWGGARWL